MLRRKNPYIPVVNSATIGCKRKFFAPRLFPEKCVDRGVGYEDVRNLAAVVEKHEGVPKIGECNKGHVRPLFLVEAMEFNGYERTDPVLIPALLPAV